MSQEALPPRPAKPLPHEHREIAVGSGAAAILLFLHIAVIGYLGYIIYFLLRGNTAVFWNLVPTRSVLFFYFPAAFALLTYLPTNNLTRTVGRIALIFGALAAIVYGAGLIVQAFSNTPGGITLRINTVVAIAGGVAAAMLLRAGFAAGMGRRRAEFKKNSSSNVAS